MNKGIINKCWPVEAIDTLTQLYPNHTNAFIAETLGKKEPAIIAKAFKLRLVKDKEFIRQCALKSTFKPGHIPLNKGKKQSDYMSADAIERTARTRFKKGNQPHNTRESDGEISIRKKEGEPPYKFIRVALGRWVLLHRYNWEQVNGSIPQGHCLWCLGDSLNCEPGNWELITRKENRIRNSGTRDLSDKRVANYLSTSSRKVDLQLREVVAGNTDLIQAKRTQLLINRKIKKLTKNGTEQNRRS